MKHVNFIKMAHGTVEEYQFLDRVGRAYIQGTAGRVLDAMRALDDSLSGYKVTRLEHSLQTATRAHHDGASEEMVVAALLHDIGDGLAPHSHGELAAAILKAFVSEETHWIIQHHGIFQGYYYFHHLGEDRNLRDRYRDHPYYDACVRFCADWDQCSFDPDYDTLPLSHFEPMVHRVFARVPFKETGLKSS